MTGASASVGAETFPERIKENRPDYVAALRAADVAWEGGNLDFSEMENFVAGLLQAQLSNA